MRDDFHGVTATQTTESEVTCFSHECLPSYCFPPPFSEEPAGFESIAEPGSEPVRFSADSEAPVFVEELKDQVRISAPFDSERSPVYGLGRCTVVGFSLIVW